MTHYLKIYNEWDTRGTDVALFWVGLTVNKTASGLWDRVGW